MEKTKDKGKFLFQRGKTEIDRENKVEVRIKYRKQSVKKIRRTE